MEASAQDHGKKVTINVFAPGEPDPRAIEVRLDEKVEEAAARAAKEFGYEAEHLSFQPAIFGRHKTLHEEHVYEGQHLELVTTGGGV
jgi:hypothetical protein